MLVTDKAIAGIFEKTIERVYGNYPVKPVDISLSAREEFGDFQTNFAMMNTKIIGDNPRNIAKKIQENFEKNEIIEKLEIAGPGFINIFL
ncbi:MAG: arginine--tRNA ligase, partial [Fusobacteriaceae bacterium]|nr:arginine--tRNA ligase [Fusobacteriaceae bacterium]